MLIRMTAGQEHGSCCCPLNRQVKRSSPGQLLASKANFLAFNSLSLQWNKRQARMSSQPESFRGPSLLQPVIVCLLASAIAIALTAVC